MVQILKKLIAQVDNIKEFSEFSKKNLNDFMINILFSAKNTTK